MGRINQVWCNSWTTQNYSGQPVSLSKQLLIYTSQQFWRYRRHQNFLQPKCATPRSPFLLLSHLGSKSAIAFFTVHHPKCTVSPVTWRTPPPCLKNNTFSFTARYFSSLLTNPSISSLLTYLSDPLHRHTDPTVSIPLMPTSYPVIHAMQDQTQNTEWRGCFSLLPESLQFAPTTPFVTVPTCSHKKIYWKCFFFYCKALEWYKNVHSVASWTRDHAACLKIYHVTL